jgi:hypothetical protein
MSNEKVQLVNPLAAMRCGAHSKGRTPNGLTNTPCGWPPRAVRKDCRPCLGEIPSSTGKHRTEFVDGQRADLARDLESRALPGALAPIRIIVGFLQRSQSCGGHVEASLSPQAPFPQRPGSSHCEAAQRSSNVVAISLLGGQRFFRGGGREVDSCHPHPSWQDGIRNIILRPRGPTDRARGTAV